MKTITELKIGIFLFIILLNQSCNTLFNLPTNSDQSTLGEATQLTSDLKKLPPPKEKIVVGVYKFRDQSGQYKPSENGSNWSTAVPQGTTTILIKALEDSQWFIPIERENIANLLNERQIIRSTRQEYSKETEKNNQILPPLLYAGILLEGGIISYDTNVMTGGIGARYFGIGGSTQYRQDRITVYLRAVSTLNGEILKTVYTSKNILSTSVNGSLFKYIDTERLMEAEVGVSQNEPVQMAVTEAIEKAVKSLIIEGIDDKIWGTTVDDKDPQYEYLVQEYRNENTVNETRLIGNKVKNSIRNNVVFDFSAELQQINGDYGDAEYNLGWRSAMRFALGKNFYLGISANYIKIENKNILERKAFGPEINIEYQFMPQYKLSPFVYTGAGGLFSKYKPYYKVNTGVGLEYLLTKNLAIRGYYQYDLGFVDSFDSYYGGKQNDNLNRIGFGISYYVGK